VTESGPRCRLEPGTEGLTTRQKEPVQWLKQSTSSNLSPLWVASALVLGAIVAIAGMLLIGC
jgi:hypothetical protein